MAQTLNLDVVGIANRINRFINELQMSQSSNVSLTLEADKVRFSSYVTALRFLVGHVVAEPQLDLPETNPLFYDVRDTPALLDVENENVQHLSLLLKTAKDELMLSQSSRLSTGLISFDRDRFLAILDKCENYLSDYVQNATPLDLPESSPRAALQGPGKNTLGA